MGRPRVYPVTDVKVYLDKDGLYRFHAFDGRGKRVKSEEEDSVGYGNRASAKRAAHMEHPEARIR